MSDKEKKRFQDMADRDKKRYESEMQSYVPVAGKSGGRAKKGKKIKDPNAPKRSLSAFFHFCSEHRGAIKDQNPEFGVGDIAKELGKMWGEVDPETKRSYEAKAEHDKQRYERDLAAYKAKCAQQQGDDDDEEEDEEDEDDE